MIKMVKRIIIEKKGEMMQDTVVKTLAPDQ